MSWKRLEPEPRPEPIGLRVVYRADGDTYSVGISDGRTTWAFTPEAAHKIAGELTRAAVAAARPKEEPAP